MKLDDIKKREPGSATLASEHFIDARAHTNRAPTHARDARQLRETLTFSFLCPVFPAALGEEAEEKEGGDLARKEAGAERCCNSSCCGGGCCCCCCCCIAALPLSCSNFRFCARFSI